MNAIHNSLLPPPSSILFARSCTTGFVRSLPPRCLGLAISACLLFTLSCGAYVDLAPTLVKIISDSQKIQLVEVVSFDPDKHLLVLKPVRAFKGALDPNPIPHDVAPANSTLVPRTIQQWAEPGARGVLFSSRATQLLCLGEGWYNVRSSGSNGWKLGTERADLPLAYYGTVSRLAEGLDLMLAGKDAMLTMVQHGVDDAASFDLALNRASMPGLIRLQRIRANMQMPTTVAGVSANPAWFIGRGRVGEEDLPKLLDRLKDSDPNVRAGAADELRDLGHQAAPAEATLTALLTDASPGVRFESAATLLCIGKDTPAAVDTLAKGLTDSQPAVRRDAARAVGHSGLAATPLVDKLAPLLKDQSAPVRISALQAIALLGPAAAAAAPAIVPLLNGQETCIEAADALGRIGPRARPVPPRLVEMLSSEQTAIQWAAVRAMAQIGGKEAHPAVEFIVKELPAATEINGYNMMIYLALLGPDASDAVDAVQTARVAHPVIPSATVWAITTNGYPWQVSGGRGGFGGPGGGLGPPGGLDLSTTMYEAYIRELGERLRPLALSLVQELVHGTAGDVPTWGYKLLACAPEETTSKLSACLADSDLTARERAAVALGYMGPTAFPAKAAISNAIAKASNDQERRLLQWCLSEVSL